MSEIDFSPLILSLKLAFWTTLILLIISVPLGYFIAYSKKKIFSLIELLSALPLVIPPTVLGFYFLLFFSKEGTIGKLWYKIFGKQLVFSFEGIVLASVIYSLPMMIFPIVSGYRSVPKNLIEASLTLGKSHIETLFKVVLPNMKASIFSGIALTFAHTLGEFGVVLMVGGNIPGETRVVSIAIYDAVEAIDYKTAHFYSSILLFVSFLTLLIFYRLNKRWKF